MRLTQWTDYTLRVLMYCAACLERNERVTITEIADSHGISRSHLTKIVQQMAARCWLETTRGRGGGMRLLVNPKEITLSEIVRATETDFLMVECFDPSSNQCRLIHHCMLKTALHQAMESYFDVLNGVTLADLVASDCSDGDVSQIGRVQWVRGIPDALI